MIVNFAISKAYYLYPLLSNCSEKQFRDDDPHLIWTWCVVKVLEMNAWLKAACDMSSGFPWINCVWRSVQLWNVGFTRSPVLSFRLIQWLHFARNWIPGRFFVCRPSEMSSVEGDDSKGDLPIPNSKSGGGVSKDLQPAAYPANICDLWVQLTCHESISLVQSQNRFQFLMHLCFPCCSFVGSWKRSLRWQHFGLFHTLRTSNTVVVVSDFVWSFSRVTVPR